MQKVDARVEVQIEPLVVNELTDNVIDSITDIGGARVIDLCPVNSGAINNRDGVIHSILLF
jgi:hypothetical protein